MSSYWFSSCSFTRPGKNEQLPVFPLSPNDAQIRFNLAFQNFVRVFAKAEHPLVMFLDDLQWADNSSLNFIENILQIVKQIIY